MARFRNDFNDPPEQYVDDFGQIAERPAVRVAVTQGWMGVPPGGEIDVPDDEYEHWVAGGWTPLTPPPGTQPAPPAPVPAAPPVSATTPQPAAEGSEPQ
jgi:hypothetical protein